MPKTVIENVLSINFVLVAAAVASTGLGELVFLLPEGTTPDADGVILVTSAADVDAQVAANTITSDGGDFVKLAFSQNYRPSQVYISTFAAAQTEADALDQIIAASIDIGVFVPLTRGSSQLSTLGTWLSVGDRALKYLMIAETTNTDVMTAGKPSTLSDIELDGVRLHYGGADPGVAAAFAGNFHAKGLISGPAAARAQLRSVLPPVATSSQIANILANDVGILLPLDEGSGSNTYLTDGVDSYSGQSFKAQVTLLYTVRRILGGITALINRKAVAAEPLEATATGEGEVKSAIDEQLSALAAVGHYAPGVSGSAPNEIVLADGYQTTVTSSGGTITADVLIRIGQEVHSIVVNGIGEVV